MAFVKLTILQQQTQTTLLSCNGLVVMLAVITHSKISTNLFWPLIVQFVGIPTSFWLLDQGSVLPMILVIGLSLVLVSSPCLSMVSFLPVM